MPAGQVHSFAFKRGTQGWVVTLATEILDEALQPAGRIAGACCRNAAALRRHATDAPVHEEDLSRDYGARRLCARTDSHALSALLLGQSRGLMSTAEKAPVGAGRPDIF